MIIDESALPPSDEWNAARQHSIDNPTHILGPYEGDLGQIHMECVGDGDPYEPNCDFDTATLPVANGGDRP